MSSLRTANADLTERLAEATQIIVSILSDKPLHGTYYHLPFCSGSRDVPPGTPGYSCCCLPSKRKAKEQIADLEKRLADLGMAERAATTRMHHYKGCNDTLETQLAAALEREKVLAEAGKALVDDWHSTDQYKAGEEWGLMDNMEAALAGIPVKSEDENKGKAEEEKP